MGKMLNCCLAVLLLTFFLQNAMVDCTTHYHHQTDHDHHQPDSYQHIIGHYYHKDDHYHPQPDSDPRMTSPSYPTDDNHHHQPDYRHPMTRPYHHKEDHHHHQPEPYYRKEEPEETSQDLRAPNETSQDLSLLKFFKIGKALGKLIKPAKKVIKHVGKAVDKAQKVVDVVTKTVDTAQNVVDKAKDVIGRAKAAVDKVEKRSENKSVTEETSQNLEMTKPERPHSWPRYIGPKTDVPPSWASLADEFKRKYYESQLMLDVIKSEFDQWYRQRKDSIHPDNEPITTEAPKPWELRPSAA